MSSRIHKALSAAIATAMLGAAAVAFVPATASAQVLMARSECVDGVWHVITYDISNPNAWVVTSDEPTAQPCGGQALALNFIGHFGRDLLLADRGHDRGDFGRDMRPGSGRDHISGVEHRSSRE